MGTWTNGPYHDAWEAFMNTERMQLQERASGKMRRAIGRVLPGESREELERIAAKDQRLARAGFVKVRRGERFSYKHIDNLTREDRWARIEAERATTAWLRGRIEGERIAAQLRENARGPAQRFKEAKRRPGSRRVPALWPPMQLSIDSPPG